jgi:predicted dehydrogenase
MHKTRWGIIGSGNIADAFAHSIKYCQNSELISVFGRNSETVSQFSTKFDINPYLDLHDFLSSMRLMQFILLLLITRITFTH